ncbi:MAG TPA: UDP-N-acetylmuramoyl-tripeptide--D-alanyl-D-alanine ligase [Thermomicrobiales bacterium]|jgi:UDP-N-acetylmuramoyl-tripeptide--D-alanyl-D-alanine ligase|nr:UDP-N-acetylmuramoyl-tripeptide--D-alanyl-D-alanine ligase [Thermomicrobiales bacterium]
MNPMMVSALVAGLGAELRGELLPNRRVTSIERDSRRVQAGDVFIAIRGEAHDGHEFVGQAQAAGAVAAIVARDWADRQPGRLAFPLLVVDDTVAALQRLAATVRRGRDLRVVGITGSIGKTSTKEVVAAVLSGRFRTYRSPGNLNNEIGLPLSLLDVGPREEVAVLEMGGAYAFGELALLAEIARPSVAVVTNVYPVHIERMGSIEAIAETKSELVRAIPANGVVILNGDDHRVRAMADLTEARVITYGLGADNDIRGEDVVSEGLQGTRFRLFIGRERYQIKVPLIGGHAVQLALSAFAVGHGMGMHISEMLPGFDNQDVQVRLLIMVGPNGSQIIDDTYNASPPSVLSALGLLEELHARRSIAVLGDMRELGADEDEEHRIVARRAAEVADLVVTYGELGRIIADEIHGMSLNGEDVPAVRAYGEHERDDLIAYLSAELREGDVVLLKGSRGLKMEQIVQAITLPTPGQDLDGAPLA